MAIEIIEEQILPYPYTYLPARAVRVRNEYGTDVRWYDIDTGIELPPYFGLGKEANRMVKEWYDEQKTV